MRGNRQSCKQTPKNRPGQSFLALAPVSKRYKHWKEGGRGGKVLPAPRPASERACSVSLSLSACQVTFRSRYSPSSSFSFPSSFPGGENGNSSVQFNDFIKFFIFFFFIFRGKGRMAPCFLPPKDEDGDGGASNNGTSPSLPAFSPGTTTCKHVLMLLNERTNDAPTMIRQSAKAAAGKLIHPHDDDSSRHHQRREGS